jgi:type II secretory pathway pseudopilin PulG
MPLIAFLRARGHDERGFTMVTVMTVMLCVTLLSVAALAAAQGDLKPGAHDKSRKVAYAAAEAGVQNYLFHLSQDLDYWAKCDTGALPQAVNQPWNGISSDPRRWTTLSAGASRYTLELLPVTGSTCSVANPASSMIDITTGTFKIRSTGEDLRNGAKRSIVATFRKRSFLDYLYFTDKETRSPGLYGINVPSRNTRLAGQPGSRDLLTWAREDCDTRYWGTDPVQGSRGAQSYDGEFERSPGSWEAISNPALTCNAPELKGGEDILGPMHTNDEFKVDCDGPSPKLGRDRNDAIETSGLGRAGDSGDLHRGWYAIDSNGTPCGGTPDVNYLDDGGEPRRVGMWTPGAEPLQLPLTNNSLLADTAAAYRFKGTTKIVMSGTTMRVTGTRTDGTSLVDQDVAIPSDGVVYVANNGTCTPYNAVESGAEPATCGNLELRGNYAANVTFTAENDILMTGDTEQTSDDSPFLLGLIATNFVRINHPVTSCEPVNTCNFRPHVDGGPACVNAAGSPSNLTIEAAIVSLTQSFIVDNWFCGAPLGRLTILGAVAQKHRGPLRRDNTIGGAIAGTSGFDDKDYKYDDRLKYRSPPHFLDPVQAQWRVQIRSEQVPAR